MTKIKFGTDGWRAAIAEDYTFHNVRRCARGVAEYLLKNGGADRGVVVAHDQDGQVRYCDPTDGLKKLLHRLGNAD